MSHAQQAVKIPVSERGVSATPVAVGASERPPYLMAACVTLAALVLYVLTVAPTTQFWDTSEYLAAAYVLGIPHPPGNPLFTIIAHTWGLLPLAAGYAMRINLLAAATSAVAAGCWFLVGERLMRAWVPAVWPRRLAALAGAVCAATAFTVWNQSVVNEKVYTLSLLSVALVLWLILRWDDQPLGEAHDHHLLLIVYLIALTATNHMMGVLVGPVVVVLLFPPLRSVRPVDEASRRVEWSQWFVFCSVYGMIVATGLESATPLFAVGVLFLAAFANAILRARNWDFAVAVLAVAVVGLSVYLFLPIRAAHYPPINEGEPTTWKALWEVLTRQQYGKPPVSQRQASLVAQTGPRDAGGMGRGMAGAARARARAPLAVRHAAAAARADSARRQPTHGVTRGRDAGARFRVRHPPVGRAVRCPRHRGGQRHLPAMVRAGGRGHSQGRHRREPVARQHRLVPAAAATATTRRLRARQGPRAVPRAPVAQTDGPAAQLQRRAARRAPAGLLPRAEAHREPGRRRRDARSGPAQPPIPREGGRDRAAGDPRPVGEAADLLLAHRRAVRRPVRPHRLPRGPGVRAQAAPGGARRVGQHQGGPGPRLRERPAHRSARLPGVPSRRGGAQPPTGLGRPAVRGYPRDLRHRVPSAGAGAAEAEPAGGDPGPGRGGFDFQEHHLRIHAAGGTLTGAPRARCPHMSSTWDADSLWRSFWRALYLGSRTRSAPTARLRRAGLRQARHRHLPASPCSTSTTRHPTRRTTISRKD